MGKIRIAKLGDESTEKELKRRAEARRETKKSKKAKIEHVGLKGGERVAVVEGTEIKPEFRKLVEEVEQSAQPEKSPKQQEKTKKEGKSKTRSKKYKTAAGLVDKTKLYSPAEAVALAKKTSLTRFDGTLELHLNLNVQAMGDKKDLRGEVNLPHGSGKTVTVAIADEKVLAQVESGKIDFDILVATPAMMPRLAKFARILGPKGLMPNPKSGTVTDDPQKRAKELSHGKVHFKTEPENPILHMSIGKISFTAEQLEANLNAVVDAIGKAKIAKATLSATMGPGIKLKVS